MSAGWMDALTCKRPIHRLQSAMVHSFGPQAAQRFFSHPPLNVPIVPRWIAADKETQICWSRCQTKIRGEGSAFVSFFFFFFFLGPASVSSRKDVSAECWNVEEITLTSRFSSFWITQSQMPKQRKKILPKPKRMFEFRFFFFFFNLFKSIFTAGEIRSRRNVLSFGVVRSLGLPG